MEQVGSYDYVGAEAVEPFLDGSMHARGVTFEKSGHMPHLDDKDAFLPCIATFLDE